MGVEDHSDTTDGTMIPENALVADTQPPEKTVNDPDSKHGTHATENKELPRTITGWKVNILGVALLE